MKSRKIIKKALKAQETLKLIITDIKYYLILKKHPTEIELSINENIRDQVLIPISLLNIIESQLNVKYGVSELSKLRTKNISTELYLCLYKFCESIKCIKNVNF